MTQWVRNHRALSSPAHANACGCLVDAASGTGLAVKAVRPDHMEKAEIARRGGTSTAGATVGFDEQSQDTELWSAMEHVLEETGTTGMLRPQKDKEVEREQLERAMYDLNPVTDDVVGKLRREPWQAPSWPLANAHYGTQKVHAPVAKHTQVRAAALLAAAKVPVQVATATAGSLGLPVVSDDPKPFPVCSTFTGRLCFLTGFLKSWVGMDPFGEGTTSEVRAVDRSCRHACVE